MLGLMALGEVTAEVRTGVSCGSKPGLPPAVFLGRGTRCPGVRGALLQPWAEVPHPWLSRWLRAQPRGPRGGSLLPGAACGGGGQGVGVSVCTCPRGCLRVRPRACTAPGPLQAAMPSTRLWFRCAVSRASSLTRVFWSWQASPEKARAVHTGGVAATVPQSWTTGNEWVRPRAHRTWWTLTFEFHIISRREILFPV